MSTIIFILIFIGLGLIKNMTEWAKLILKFLVGAASVVSGIESYVNITAELAADESVKNEEFINSLQKTKPCANGSFLISTSGSDLEINGRYYMDESVYIYTKSGFAKGKYHIEELLLYDQDFDDFCTKIGQFLDGDKCLDIFVAGFADGVGCLLSCYRGDLGEFIDEPYYLIEPNGGVTLMNMTLKPNQTIMSNDKYAFLRGVSIQRNFEKRFKNIKMTTHPIYVGLTNRKGENYRKVEIKIVIKNAYKYKQKINAMKKIYNFIA